MKTLVILIIFSFVFFSSATKDYFRRDYSPAPGIRMHVVIGDNLSELRQQARNLFSNAFPMPQLDRGMPQLDRGMPQLDRGTNLDLESGNTFNSLLGFVEQMKQSFIDQDANIFTRSVNDFDNNIDTQENNQHNCYKLIHHYCPNTVGSIRQAICIMSHIDEFASSAECQQGQDVDNSDVDVTESDYTQLQEACQSDLVNLEQCSHINSFQHLIECFWEQSNGMLSNQCGSYIKSVLLDSDNDSVRDSHPHRKGKKGRHHHKKHNKRKRKSTDTKLTQNLDKDTEKNTFSYLSRFKSSLSHYYHNNKSVIVVATVFSVIAVLAVTSLISILVIRWRRNKNLHSPQSSCIETASCPSAQVYSYSSNVNLKQPSHLVEEQNVSLISKE